MYDQYYGFTGRPFQLTPDPNFYFESGTHRKAMSYLGYGLAQGEGFIVITGDVGAGKTTLVGHLMNTIDPSRLTAVKLVSTQVEGDDLLRLVAEQFGLDWEGESKAELLRSMEQYLREQARAGRRTLLIVDEGQNLAISALEELRMLSNFQLGGHSLLQIFLLGQPEFRQTLFHSPSLEQLRQRVIATHHLDPMEPEEVEPYILHRLGKVGWTGNPSFSPDAFEEIFDHSEGVPRKLNVLVSRLLLFGAVEQLNRITGHHVRAVVAEVEADRGFDEKALVPPVPEAVFAVPAASAPAHVPPPPKPVASLVAVPEAVIRMPTPPAAPVVDPFAEEPLELVVEADAEAPLEWPAPAASAEPDHETASFDPVSVAGDAPPFAAPELVHEPAPEPEAEPVRGLERLARWGMPEEAEPMPLARGPASFVEARSLVAEQLGLASAAPEPAPEPVLAAVNEPFERVEALAGFDAPAADAVGSAAPETSVAEPAPAAPPVDDAQLVALQRQIAGLEARIAEQDLALRRVLDLLIDWVERDPANAPDPTLTQGWAA